MCNSAASHLIMKCDMSINHFDGAHYLVRNDQEFETGENKANFLKYKYNKPWTENHANHCKIQHFQDVNGHDLIL